MVKDAGVYHMWYSIPSPSRPYRVGGADLADGLRWTRRDNEAGIYQFQVQQIEARAPGRNERGPRPSVGVLASLDDSLKDGSLIVGRLQATDRDLFFEAHSDDSAFADLR